MRTFLLRRFRFERQRTQSLRCGTHIRFCRRHRRRTHIDGVTGRRAEIVDEGGGDREALASSGIGVHLEL